MTVTLYTAHLPHPDGFRIITVGTGAPHYNPSRASACTLIQYRDTSILVDLGYGSVGRMLDHGLDALQIPNVMFTHCLHLDHTLDYGYYMCMSMNNGLPLNLYGPPGTEKLHNSMFDLYKEQLGIAKRGRKEISIRELADGDRFNIGPVSVQVCEVPHVVQNYAYRFSAGSQSVVVTGDMAYCEHFAPFAKDADAVIFDANSAPSEFSKRMAERRARRNMDSEGPVRQVVKAHADLEEIADMSEQAGAGALILTHFTKEPDLEETRRRVTAVYHGPVIMGEDMLTITLQPQHT